MMKKWLCALLTLALMLPLAAGAVLAEGDREGGPMELERLDAIPDYQWQKTAAFPDWKGYTDDTLAMNSMFSFLGYHGQGEIFLSVSEGVESFSLYVNGVRLNTPAPAPGAWRADLSGCAVDGVNTLQITNILPLGMEKPVTVYIPYPVVLNGTDGEGGVHPLALKLVSDIIEADVRHGFTSAQLAVVRNGRLIYQNAWGRTNSYAPDGTPLSDSAPVTNDTLYDLASVTKMFAAEYAVQKLATDGLLDVNAPVVSLLGDAFADDTLDFAYAQAEDPPTHETQIAWKRSLTLRDLLCHEAGFPVSPHYNNPDFDMALQAVTLPGANLCYAAGRDEVPGAIFKTPLLYQPGSRTLYSDVDYMLVCFIVEAVTGQRLDDWLRENFFEPMGLERICFLPLENGFSPDDCAATELNGNTRDGRLSFPGIRTETIQGQVQDERAWYCMEGVSGHAGLFASATDLAKLASVMLTGGWGEHRFFSRNAIDLFTAPKSLGSGQWGLGWHRMGDDQRPWYFGTQAAPNAIGHQGWTGTLAMIDPSRQLVVVYLTNKINAPVTGSDNINKFDACWYTASTLGFVPQLLSIGMDSDADIAPQLNDLLADMAAESLKLVPEGAGADHPAVKNALSKLELLSRIPEYAAFAAELEGLMPVEE